MRNIFIGLSLLVISVSLYAEVFSYKYNLGEKYKIVSIVDESIYLDGAFHLSIPTKMVVLKFRQIMQLQRKELEMFRFIHYPRNIFLIL
ncbi:MAG: hypothetical protein J7L71_08515 [Spirochaetaceae bacterium]|nr:hypothetical protein [Spirochaetaceae bacterium]